MTMKATKLPEPGGAYLFYQVEMEGFLQSSVKVHAVAILADL